MVELSRKEDINRNFDVSLQTLALESQVQIKSIGPGCVACELLNDFDTDSKFYIEECGDQITEKQLRIIKEILNYMDTMPEEDCECFNSDVLKRKSWQKLRSMARDALPIFNLSLEDMPSYEEKQLGIWQSI